MGFGFVSEFGFLFFLFISFFSPIRDVDPIPFIYLFIYF